jgi:hypothetical protein
MARIEIKPENGGYIISGLSEMPRKEDLFVYGDESEELISVLAQARFKKKFPQIQKIVLLLLTDATDLILIHTDFPSTMPDVDNQCMILETKCVQNGGLDYIRNNFGCEPDEVINTRHYSKK